jgi:hypothetical protein
MAFVVVEDEAANPIDVGALGLIGEAAEPRDSAHVVEESWF